jgi:hypothetical protein
MEERTAQTNDGVVSYADDHGEDGDVNEAVFTDGTGEEAQGESAEKTEGKTVQSKEQNSANARRRREAEQKKLIEKTRQEAIIEALGGTNPFTNEKMVDSADVDEYLLMKRISDEGGDPVEDYSKYRKRADKDTASKAAAETERQENAKKELAEFSEKYPDIKSDELFKDEDFMEFADGKFGAKTLVEIYDSYKTFIAKYSTEADKKAARIMANAKATPGALATANTSTEQFFTREQVNKMSHDEVRRHYDTIRKSMSKWK